MCDVLRSPPPCRRVEFTTKYFYAPSFGTETGFFEFNYINIKFMGDLGDIYGLNREVSYKIQREDIDNTIAEVNKVLRRHI
jgi:hypothetical protein